MDKVLTGLVRKINRYSVTDGPGIRSVIFLKGCPLRCKWCSSPQTWLLKQELIFFQSKCIEDRVCILACPEDALRLENGKLQIERSKCRACGSCSEACYSGALEIVGKRMTVDEIMEMVLRDRHYYVKSGGGITLSGGEPLFQRDFSVALLQKAHNNGINTAVETTGHLEWNDLKQALPHTDILLYDLKHMDNIKHKAYTGVSNEKILGNLIRSAKYQPQVRIVACFPYIPGYNTSSENIQQMIEFLEKNGIMEIDIFPFHKLGMHEYDELDISYPVQDLKIPTDEDMSAVERVFADRGFIISEW